MCQPVTEEKKALLRKRWSDLPESLRVANQVVGKHWVHCGYTLGPAYCSFGCSHCYLPKGANRLPLVSLGSMRAQIDTQRRLMGPGGNLQITGGDVVEAYWRAGRKAELVEIIRYANQQGLVPMLMTHGQVLLDHPAYLERLVVEGGLRKLSVHIDTTMAGRPGFPARTLKRERDLNPLRDRLVRQVQAVRRTTGKSLVAALTVTVTNGNITSIGDILGWLMSHPDRMDVCRTISFQTEASVGRTRSSAQPVKPEVVWRNLVRAVGKPLGRDHLLFGHPDCSSAATLLVCPSRGEVVNLAGHDAAARALWHGLLETFGGVGARSVRPAFSLAQKVGAVLRRPGLLAQALRFCRRMVSSGEVSTGFVCAAIRGKVRGFNLVMHNFMSSQELVGPVDRRVAERLRACSFRGVVEEDGEWRAVSMCEMNATLRPALYREAKR